MTRAWSRHLVWTLGLCALSLGAVGLEGLPARPRKAALGQGKDGARWAASGGVVPGRPATSLGPSGAEASEAVRPFSLPRARALADRVDRLGDSGATVVEPASRAKALSLLPAFRQRLVSAESGEASAADLSALSALESELESLEGAALKGSRRLASCRSALGLAGSRERVPSGPEAPLAPSKVNTGWILDQHLFDPDAPRYLPTLLSDFRNFDIGRSDIAMGHSDHPTGGMFGWMWHVQSFYWTDTSTVADHPNASYCLILMASGDGGSTWFLYDLLYDPATSPAVSRDLINPKLALDVSGTYDIYYIAYERVASAADHDVYVYYDLSELPCYDGTPGGTSSPIQVGIGTTTNMERNPAIASEYKTSDATRYQVVAYEYAYSATDYDIRAAQSYGNGSATWTAAADVAATAAMETHPALSAGASGGTTFTANLHLAYNYDTYAASGAQLLLNPGFESGANGNWTVSSSGGYAVIESNANARSGSYVAWLCGYTSASESLTQAVSIPPGAQSASLSFWVKISSADSTTVANDYFYAELLDGAGTLLQTLATLSNVDEAAYTAYQQVNLDLSAYRGQTVRVRLRGTNDGVASTSTSFFVDDTALVLGAYNTASEVRYARAAHPTGSAPGTTTYPAALASFPKLTVLANRGGTTAWPYGPPAIGASHGGSTTVTGGRLLVAADQFFPKDQPAAGAPARYQLNYAVNMCNGSTTCGNISGCSPTLSLNWNAYYWNDSAGDTRFPSIVVDGVGWVEGTSGIGQNGVVTWPEMFMAYYYRDFKSPSDLGGAHMALAFADDETCTGFQSGAWYTFTASEKASNDDDRVVPKEGTIATFNYFAGWPGVVFNKNLYHAGATINDDPYFTTPGDNYTIDTTVDGLHIDAYWTFNSVSYLGPWTFPWPAAMEWDITVSPDAVHGDRYYTFGQWSSGETTLTVTIPSDYCSPTPPCPVTSINALFGGGCLTAQPSVTGLTATAQGGDVQLAWVPAGPPGDVVGYTVHRATDCSAVGNYSPVGATASASFTDTEAPGSLYFYIVTATCGPYSGPWDHYGQ